MLITLKRPPISKLNITNHNSLSFSKEAAPTSQQRHMNMKGELRRRNLKKEKKKLKKAKEKSDGENDLDLTIFPSILKN